MMNHIVSTPTLMSLVEKDSLKQHYINTCRLFDQVQLFYVVMNLDYKLGIFIDEVVETSLLAKKSKDHWTWAVALKVGHSGTLERELRKVMGEQQDEDKYRFDQRTTFKEPGTGRRNK